MTDKGKSCANACERENKGESGEVTRCGPGGLHFLPRNTEDFAPAPEGAPSGRWVKWKP